MFRVVEETLTVGGARMHHIAFGRGERPLIMLQGLNTRGIKGSGIMLSLLYREFSRRYRVHLFDRREDIPEDATIKLLAGDVAAAMDSLGIRDADILGVSQGGMIAMELAITRPELIRRMVLAVTAARSTPEMQEAITHWVECSQKGDYKSLVAHMAEHMYSEEYLRRYRPLLPLLTLAQKPQDPRRFIRLAKSCLTVDTLSRLSAVKIPALVIAGGMDRIVGPSSGDEIAEALHCQKHIYPALGHAAYEEARDFNARVLEFLTE